MLSTFFDNPKLASEITTFIQNLSSFAFFLILLQEFRENSFFIGVLTFIFPTSGITLAYAAGGLKLGFLNAAGMDWSMEKGYVLLIISAVFYFLAYLWLD